MSPSTTFEIRRPPWWWPAWLALHLLVGLTLTAWIATLWASESWTLLGASVLAVAGWLLAIGWRPTSDGDLRFDGQVWFLRSPTSGGVFECEGSLSLAIDAGGWMLLRFRCNREQRPVPGTVWLLLGRGDSAHDWSALRRAVYSPRPDPAGLSAQATVHPPA